jgi:uncharacterized protein (TIGR03437 family)
MKTLVLTLFVIAASLCATIASAQPVVTQVSNAASESLALSGTQGEWETLPNASISQGSFFAIYGTGFGVSASTCATDYYNCYWKPYPLPTSLQGTSVSVTVNGTTVAAYIEYAAESSSAAQINAVLPSNTPIGTGALTVKYNGAASASVPITVVAGSFGTFTWTGAGTGPGIFINAVTYAFFTPFTSAKPSTSAAAGDYVTIWGSGLGPVPSATDEQKAAPLSTDQCPAAFPCPTVYVGGEKATVTYAGRSGYTAVDQIDFIVPPNVQGCNIPVAVVTGSVTSNVNGISVDPSGASCTDADGVDMSYISALVSSKGYADIGVIGLSSQLWNINLGQDAFQQWLDDSVTAQIGKFLPYTLDTIQGLTQAPSAGTAGNCTAAPYQGYPPPIDYGFGSVTSFDAGPALSILSPVGSVGTQPVPQVTNAVGSPAGYAGVVGGITPLPTGNILDFQQWQTPFFWLSTANSDGTFNVNGISSGTYTVTAPGGKDVPAFTAMLDVLSSDTTFQWTNSSTFANENGTPPISRDTPLTITWSGGNPEGFMDITLIGSTVTFTVPSDLDPGVQVECVVPTNLGAFTVPTYMLETLPASVSGPLAAGMVLVGPISAPQKISPPPMGLDALYMYYRLLSGYTVTWQ